MTTTGLNQRRQAATGFLLSLLIIISNSASARSTELPDFETLVSNQRASVVNIQTRRSGFAPAQIGDPNSTMPEFRRRFREFRSPHGRPPQRSRHGIGSGIIASADGYILTNAHVVEGATEIIVHLSDQRELPATLVGTDTYSDIAILKIEANELPAATFGDSDQLKVGQWVLAIGAPFGLEQTATQGIVSAVSRSLPNDNYVPFIQTDVAVNPGNSGGPLFNLQGQVIGINSQIYSRSGGYMGLSFAIPINLALSIAERLKTGDAIERGWLGVAIQDLNQGLADSFGLDTPHGALVSKVIPNSPAARANLKVGDVIVEFAGHAIKRSASLPLLVAASVANSATTMRILRNGQMQTIKITVGLLADDPVSAAAQSSGPLGIVVSDISPKDRASIGLENGVRVERVESGKPAANAGLQPNDIIISYDHNSIDNVADLADLSRRTRPGKTVSLLVQRHQQTQFLALKFPEKHAG